MPEQPINIPNLTETQKIFASIMENQISLNTAINDLQELTARHHKLLLDGNGEIPLVEQVRNNTAFINGIKYWIKYVFGALILQTIAFGVAIVIAVVRFLPVLERLAKTP